MKLKTACLAASLAAAGLATTGMAQAQSSVTLYGIVDINVEAYTNADNGRGGSHTATGMRSGGQNGSRWGLRGSEDLGNGLKAIFTLEAGFSSNNGQGDGRAFNRTSMVGLAGNWGELTFGRQYTSAWSVFGRSSPMSYASQYEPLARLVPSRADNSIKYRGQFGGADFSAYYAFTDQADQMAYDADVTGGYGIALGYKFGMFRIMGGWDRLEEQTDGATGAVVVNQGDNYLLGLRADFNKFKVTGAYRYRDIEAPVGPDIKSHLYMLGLAYQVTPAAGVELAYYHENFKHDLRLAGMSDDKWQQISLRGTYALSKRTNFYATVAHSIDGPLNLNNSAYRIADGEDSQTGVAIGLRHLF